MIAAELERGARCAHEVAGVRSAGQEPQRAGLHIHDIRVVERDAGAAHGSAEVDSACTQFGDRAQVVEHVRAAGAVKLPPVAVKLPLLVNVTPFRFTGPSINVTPPLLTVERLSVFVSKIPPVMDSDPPELTVNMPLPDSVLIPLHNEESLNAISKAPVMVALPNVSFCTAMFWSSVIVPLLIAAS